MYIECVFLHLCVKLELHVTTSARLNVLTFIFRYSPPHQQWEFNPTTPRNTWPGLHWKQSITTELNLYTTPGPAYCIFSYLTAKLLQWLSVCKKWWLWWETGVKWTHQRLLWAAWWARTVRRSKGVVGTGHQACRGNHWRENETRLHTAHRCWDSTDQKVYKTEGHV